MTSLFIPVFLGNLVWSPRQHIPVTLPPFHSTAACFDWILYLFVKALSERPSASTGWETICCALQAREDSKNEDHFYCRFASLHLRR